MRMIGSHREYLTVQAERAERARSMRDMRWRRKCSKAKEYREGRHIYQLVIGETKQDEFKTMTGGEAHIVRCKLEALYMAALDSNGHSDERLMRWVWVSSVPAEKAEATQ